jgi:hypothetical protein
MNILNRKKSFTFFDFKIRRKKIVDSAELHDSSQSDIPIISPKWYPCIPFFSFWNTSIIPDPSSMPTHNIKQIMDDISSPKDPIMDDNKSSVYIPGEDQILPEDGTIINIMDNSGQKIPDTRPESGIVDKSSSSTSSYSFSIKNLINFIKTNIPFINSNKSSKSTNNTKIKIH